MSMWVDYIRECGILEIIEEDYGWVTFHGEPAGFVFINDMYVVPEKRDSGYGKKLLERVFAWALERGYTWVTTTVHTSNKNATVAVAAALACGFYITPSGNKDLILLGRMIEREN